MSFSVPPERVEGIQQSQKNARELLRFPLALKKARLARQLKQETLAAQLHVKLRTLVSWETGTRLPSIGIVVLLSFLLTGDLDLGSDLLRAYIADDLARQANNKVDGELQALTLHTLEQVSQLQQERKPETHLSLFGDPSGGKLQEHHLDYQSIQQQERQAEDATGNPLQQLFVVLEALRKHPELIPVVQDFLREVVLE